MFFSKNKNRRISCICNYKIIFLDQYSCTCASTQLYIILLISLNSSFTILILLKRSIFTSHFFINLFKWINHARCNFFISLLYQIYYIFFNVFNVFTIFRAFAYYIHKILLIFLDKRNKLKWNFLKKAV